MHTNWHKIQAKISLETRESSLKITNNSKQIFSRTSKAIILNACTIRILRALPGFGFYIQFYWNFHEFSFAYSRWSQIGIQFIFPSTFLKRNENIPLCNAYFRFNFQTYEF